MRNRKIYELCVSDVKPECFALFLEHTSNFMHLRVKHSDLVGSWKVDIGDKNQTVELWEYESLQHRSNVERELADDTAWHSSYIGLMKPMLVKQSSSLLLWGTDIEGIKCDIPLVTPTKCEHTTPNGHYRLVEASLPRTLASRNTYISDVVVNAVNRCAAEDRNVELYGIWFSAFAGKYNNCFTLWRSDNPDDLLFGGVPDTTSTNKWVLDEDPHSFPSHGRLLHPCSFTRFYATWS